ncbi:Short repeat-containing protein of unknown function [Actinosynnema pretiosum]|nr:Short repeat-containing protein of unknown function [Actinosynnema pretiosum]
MIWQESGAQTKAEAEKALLGTDADIEAFLTQKLDWLTSVDDRIAVNQIAAAGGPTVKGAAQKALDAAESDPSALQSFLRTGWYDATNVDLRIRVNQIAAAGGPTVKGAAQRALDAAETDPDALRSFLATASVQAADIDLRIRVNQIAAAGGAAVKAAAQKALDAAEADPNALRLFISREWEVAQARDQESASISQLVETAKQAGAQAERESLAAKDSAERARQEADLAKQAAELAAKAAEAAKDNAAGAAEAAAQAATAANRAASAATTAIGAASAATAAARIAANAAARAVTASVKAGQASSQAWEYATAARGDRERAGDARRAAAEAAKASTEAKQAIEAIDQAEKALKQADAAISAAESAGKNASESAKSADESVKWAKQAGADASEAEAAANRSRQQAALAVRAASSARAYATEAAAAAARARELALRAVADAIAASLAAEDAAAHAGQAGQAAELATQHANAATESAQIALDAAAQAARIYAAARKIDEDRLALQADQATAAARESLHVEDRIGLIRNWKAPQEDQRDEDVHTWLAEAEAPGAPVEVVESRGRKIALRLIDTAGPWGKAAAATAISGDGNEIREYVKSGIGQAAVLDDRETTRQLIAEGSESLKQAGQNALAEGDEAVRQFLRDPEHPQRATELRIRVNQVMATAREQKNDTLIAAAQLALDGESVSGYLKFLDTGQNTAREHDDRIAVNRLIADPNTGPEAKLLGAAALEGSPELVRQYRYNGQHIANRHDREAAAHNAATATMVTQAATAASRAAEHAANAQAVAATARNAAEEARGYATQAQQHADNAINSAFEAIESAKSAENSAEAAERSAQAAEDAAERASRSAVEATRSAVSARSSANIAASHANSAMRAAQQAYRDALDAGLDAEAAIKVALDARDKAVAKAEQEVEAEKAKAAAELKESCKNVPEGADRDDCMSRAMRMIADPQGESARNVAVCNQLKQDSEEAFNHCLEGAYNPALTYLVNKAIADAKDQQESEDWWTTAGFVVSGAVLIGLGIYCAEICVAPLLGALVGAEAGMLATAAGAGLEVAIGAEFITGIATDAFLASRLSALTQFEFLGGVAARSGVTSLVVDAVKHVFKSCFTAKFSSFAAEPPCYHEIPLASYGNGSQEIVNKAFEYRIKVSGATLSSLFNNLAVVKVKGWVDPFFKDDYIRMLSAGKEKHSEIRILQELNRLGIDPSRVVEVYTERSFCKKCAVAFGSRLPQGTPVYYSVKYMGQKSSDSWQEAKDLLTFFQDRIYRQGL